MVQIVQSGYGDQRERRNSRRRWSWQCWSRGHHWSFRKSLPATVQWITFLTWTNNWLSSRRKMKMRRIAEPKQCRRRVLVIFFLLQIRQLKSYVISTLTRNAALQEKGAQEPCYILIMKFCTKRRKNQKSWRYILSWRLLNHGLGLLQQYNKRFDWYFFQLPV